MKMFVTTSRALQERIRGVRLNVWTVPSARLRCFFALLCVAALYALSMNTTLYTWGDNAHYMIVGKALATGQGLTDILFPDNPPFKYPLPVLPLLLAPSIYFFDYALLPMKIVIAVIGVGVVYLTYRLFKPILGEVPALLLTLLVGVSPQIVSFSHQIMAEIPYLFFSLLAVLILEKYFAAQQGVSVLGGSAAVVLSITCLTKTIGLALVMAALLYLLCEPSLKSTKNYQKAFLLLVVVGLMWTLINIAILSELAYVRELVSRSPYTDHAEPAAVKDLMQRIFKNLRAYTTFLPETLVYSTYRISLPFVALGSVLILLVGFVFCVWTRRTVAEYYMAFYFLLLLVYEPSNSGNMQRYLVPLIPFILYYFVQGVYQLKIGLLEYGSRITSRVTVRSLSPVVRDRMRSVATGLQMATVSALILVNLTETIQASIAKTEPEMFDYYRFAPWKEYKQLALWTKQHTPQDALIMTRLVYIFHLWSQRKVVAYPKGNVRQDAQEIWQAVYKTKADYLIVDTFVDERTSTYDSLSDIIKNHPDQFSFSHQEGPHRIYRIIPSQ
jgi:4-amino-4-deoxy-L-arabinose transferase-like glycosyltransferase